MTKTTTKAKATAKSDIERQEVNREKTGVFTGAYAVNPVNGNKTFLFNTGVNKLSGLASPLNNLRLPRPPRPRPTPAPRP